MYTTKIIIVIKKITEIKNYFSLQQKVKISTNF